MKLSFSERVKAEIERSFAEKANGGFPQHERDAEFIATVFVACATVCDPKKEYHLEFIDPPENIKKVCAKFGINLKEAVRRNSTVFYLKDSEQICDLLALMGASAAMMEILNVKIEKEIRSGTNRYINAETANIDKTVEASLRQRNAIKAINPSAMSPELAALARLRLKHPDYSLAQLAAASNPPVSKSCINHRMRRLMELSGE